MTQLAPQSECKDDSFASKQNASNIPEDDIESSKSISRKSRGAVPADDKAAFSIDDNQNSSATSRSAPVIYYKANARKRTLKGHGEVIYRKSRSIPEALALAEAREGRQRAAGGRYSKGKDIETDIEVRRSDEQRLPQLVSEFEQHGQRLCSATSASPAKADSLDFQKSIDGGTESTMAIKDAIRHTGSSIKEIASKVNDIKKSNRSRRRARVHGTQAGVTLSEVREDVVDGGGLGTVVALRKAEEQTKGPISLKKHSLQPSPIPIDSTTSCSTTSSFATNNTMNTAGSFLASRRRPSRVDPHRRRPSIDPYNAGGASAPSFAQQDRSVSKSRCYQPSGASQTPNRPTSNDQLQASISSASYIHSTPTTPPSSKSLTNDQSHTLTHGPDTSNNTAPVEKLPPHKLPPRVRPAQVTETQIVTLDASYPEFDPVPGINMGNKQSESGDESVQISTDDKMSSCWSRATEPPAQGQEDLGENTHWNNNEQPSYSLNISQRGDFGKLPKYTFPGSRRREPVVNEHVIAKTSFNRKPSQVQTSLPASTTPSLIRPPHTDMTMNNPTTPKSPLPPHLRQSKEMLNGVGSQSKTDSGHEKAKKVISAMTSYTLPPHLQSPVNMQSRTPLNVGVGNGDKINGDATAKSEGESQSQNLANRKAQLAARKAEMEAQLDKEAAELEAEEHLADQQEHQQPELAHSAVADQACTDSSKGDEATPIQPAVIPTLDTQDFGIGLAKASDVGAVGDVTNTRRMNRSPLKSPSRRNGHTKGTSPKSETALNKAGKHGWEETHYDSKLQNWDGGWQPAPIGDDWTTRDKYDNSKERLAVIQTWQQDHAVDPEFQNAIVDINDQQFTTGQGVQGEDNSLARPIDHLPTKPRTDPLTQMKGSKTSQDILEEAQEKLSRSSNMKDPNAHLTKTQRRELRQALLEAEENYVPQRSPYAPEANIYLRPAEKQDLRQITDIYDHYITDTVYTPFITNEDGRWRGILADSKEDSLPFVVAIHMADKAPRNNRDISKMPKHLEHIVGFASAVDYGNRSNAYKYTVELEMWVRPEFQNKGIGRTMMDRVMGIMCPEYDTKEMVPFIAPGPMDYWIGGGRRMIKTVLFSLLTSQVEDENLKWMSKWLIREGFSQAGIVPGIAFKLGRSVQLNQFVYTTGTDISSTRSCRI